MLLVVAEQREGGRVVFSGDWVALFSDKFSLRVFSCLSLAQDVIIPSMPVCSFIIGAAESRCARPARLETG